MNASPGGKWIAHLSADTPGAVAAARCLRERLEAVPLALREALVAAADDPRPIHRLRVATRRATAALRLFHPYLPENGAARLRRRLKKLRRAAAAARLADVHSQILREQRETMAVAARPGFDRLLRSLDRERRRARVLLRRAAQRHGPAALLRAARATSADVRYPMAELLRGDPAAADRPAPRGPLFLRDVALVCLPPLVAELQTAGQTNLHEIEAVHRLRVAGKGLRYACELLTECFPPTFHRDVYAGLEAFQERLGELNDAHEISARLEFACAAAHSNGADATGVRASLAVILGELRSRRDRQHRGFLQWWAQADSRAFVEHLQAALQRLLATPLAPQAPVDLGHDEGLAGRVHSPHRRVAAIDVGTNSIRMVVAETDAVERFRVIKDVKETTRLGSGLYQTGRLRPGAVKRSIEALARMKAVAEGQGVERLRAVATSAAREAVNGPELAELVERRTGVALEIIDADTEARLAYASVANAFALDDLLTAIVDIGGGSTEVVFSRQGVIEDVFKLPLGAVRLTEAFPESPEDGRRFGDLRAAIDRVIDSAIPSVPFKPSVIIGSGGTFTNLARLSIRRGAPTGGYGRFPFDVRGHEMPHSEVAELLEWLRGMSLEERRLVPGLSSQRAEIIVAGFAIIERLATHLHAPLVRVHDGGIRDGLLAEMIDELGFGPGVPVRHSTQLLREVRRFAEQCAYEHPHSEHVAWLATRIFDQLATRVPEGGGWARPAHRDLLLAAGILHDVGVLHGMPRHHKRSYEMIMHAHLPSLTHREVEIIANIARYHRRGGPRASQRNFVRLSDGDQRLVTRLAGILRVADGLDRLHTQDVRDVRVEVNAPQVRITALADRRPKINLRVAELKADVFASAFRLTPAFDWTAAAPSELQEQMA